MRLSYRMLSTLRGKLYFLLLTALIPALLIQVGYYYQRYESRRTNAFQTNLEVARAVAGTFDQFIRDILNQELAIGISFTKLGPIPVNQMNQILEANRTEHSAVRTFSWVDPQGRVIASSRSSDVGLDLGDRDYIVKIVSGSQWVLSDLIVARSTGETIFTISRAVRDESGKLLGIIAGGIVPERLGDLIAVDLSWEGAAGIIDSRGMAVYQHPRREWTWEDRDFLKNRPEIRKALQGREEVTGIFPCRIMGEERVVALSPTRLTGWLVASSRSEKAVTSSIKSQLRFQFGLYFFLTVVVFAVAFSVSRGINSSIRKLREHALALGRGDLAHRIEISGSSEIEDLASSFNKMASLLDVKDTQRRQAQDALAKSEARYRAIVDDQTELITRFLPGGRITFVNEANCRFLGIQENDIIGRDFKHFIYKEDHVAVNGHIASINTELSMGMIEHRVLAANGEIRWIQWVNRAIFDDKGQIVEYQGVGRDVTDLKLAREALLQSEQHYRLLFETMLTGVIFQDVGGKVISLNPAAERILGKSQSVFSGQTSEDKESHTIRADGTPFTGGEHPSMVALRTGLQNRDTVMGVYNPREQCYRWISINAIPLFRRDESKPYRVYTTFEDITERRAMEKALHESRDQLELRVGELRESEGSLRRMASELLRAQESERKRIAQELHDSLASQLAAIKYCLEQKQLDSGNSVVGRISIEEIVGLTQGAIEETRRIMCNLRPAILDDLGILPTIGWFCRESHKLNPRTRIETNFELQEEDVPENLKVVMFRMLQEAMHNVSKHSRADEIKISLNMKGSMLAFRVEDNGQGFLPEDVLSREKARGGFGLAGMKERVELSGGTFRLQSAPGRGVSLLAEWEANA